MKVSIIIVSWNVRNHLQKCLDSIFKFLPPSSDREVLVVDNHSSDETQKLLAQYQKKFPSLKILFLERNIGFGPANNIGMQQSSGRCKLLLNPDTELVDASIDRMINFSLSKNDAGVVGCKHLHPDRSVQRSVRRFPTLWSQIFILLKLHHVLPHLPTIRSYFAENFDYTKTQSVEQVQGSCFLVTEKSLQRVGLFDETFPLWFEEVDYCKRVVESGLKVYYFSEAKIIHHGAQSFRQVLPLKKQKQFFSTLYRYFQKHHSIASLSILRLVQYPSYFLSWLQEKIYRTM